MKKSFLNHSMSHSFKPQKNADMLFSDDLNSFFKNRHSSHICFADDDDPDKDEPNGGTVTLTQEQLQSLIDNSVAKALESSNPNDDDKDKDKESLTEKRARLEREANEKRQHDLKQQQFAVKGMEFDNFITANESRLNGSLKGIKDDVKAAVKDPNDLSQTVPLMWATAAKTFFEDEKNLANLTKSDQEWVKSNILSVRYENQIDGLEAAKYLERAIDTAKRKDDDAARRGGGGSKGNYSGHEHLQKRMDSFFPEHVADTTGL
ncbi:hypothetical protein P7245_22420 [Vibrio parahaemolyticus]|nr:hypothetical protein [Vibrio parahaemolyticus]